MTMKIPGYFQAETGYYDSKMGRYTRRRFTDIQERMLELRIEPSEYNSKLVLRFIGGPTGHESYYLNDLMSLLAEAPPNEVLTICAGTINSWPRCWINITELQEAVRLLAKENSDAKE